jgi:protein arginine N-methyltransferase 2
MAAAGGGHGDTVRLLLEYGAPWNALDRRGKCAGEHALAAGHQPLVDLLVQAGVQAELLFRAMSGMGGGTVAGGSSGSSSIGGGGGGAKDVGIAGTDVVADTANRKYLERPVVYDGDRLLDADQRGVMMG